jgi:hypothetical protein
MQNWRAGALHPSPMTHHSLPSTRGAEAGQRLSVLCHRVSPRTQARSQSDFAFSLSISSRISALFFCSSVSIANRDL